MEFTSDDEKYGGFSQIAHQTYPVKEFDGQRYVELYIPARTAIVLKETKEAPKKSARKKAEKPEGEEAPKKPRTRKTSKKAEAAE